MLALVFSVLLTLYVIVPEAVFRFVFSIYVPTRTFTLTGTETAYRAVLIAFLPFCLALTICWYAPVARHYPFPIKQNSAQQRRTDYKLVAAAFYDDKEFEKSRFEFWPALTRSARRQARLAMWYFLLVGFEGLLSGYLASRYFLFTDSALYRWVSDRIQSPFISHWHPLLPLPGVIRGTNVQADILCSNDVLYQGNVSQYFLKEGELSGVILSKPRRFNRAPYLKEKEAGRSPEKKNYWISIPSRHLYFFADKIVNMNLTYLTETATPVQVEQFLEGEVSPLTDEFGKLSVSVKEGPMPLADSVEAKVSGTNAKKKQ
jgi:hypothetical protein